LQLLSGPIRDKKDTADSGPTSMKDPISSLRKDPEGLARHILARLAIDDSEMNEAVSPAADLVRALADSIKMMQPSTFLNAVAFMGEREPSPMSLSLVQGIVSMLEETVMEWDLIASQTRFLWSVFHEARLQFAAPGSDNGDMPGLPESEELLNDIAKRIPGIIYQFYAKDDGGMGISYSTGRFFETFGSEVDPPERFDFFLSHIAPSCRDSFLESIQNAVANETDWEFEGEYIKDSGESVFFSGRSTPVRTGDTLFFTGVLLDITARRIAERKLSESERKFSVITDLMPQIIFEIDEKGNVVFVNKQAFEFFGYEESDFPDGFNCFQHIAPEDHARVVENMEKTAQEGQSSGDEYTGIRKDGTRFPIMIYASRIMQDDRLKGYRGIIVDMARKKQAEEALIESEERLRQIIDLVPHFIFAKDSDGKFILANKAVADAYGVEVDDLIGQIDPRSFSSDHQKSALQDDLEVIHEGTRKYIPEEAVTDSEGNVRYLQTAKIPFTFSGTQTPALLGVSVDITERKAALEALRKSEERFRKYFEVPLIGVAIIDPSGHWLEVNDKFCDMVGYSRDELLGMKWQDITPAESLSSELERYLAFMESGSASTAAREKQYCTKNGMIIDVIIATHCVRKDDGTPDYLQCVIQDITERKMAECAMAASEQQLLTILSASPIGIGKVRDRIVEWVNDAICTMTGYSREELTGHDTCHLYVGPAEFERIGSLLYEEGQAETKWLTKDGSIRDMFLQVSAVDNDAYICTATDMTRLKKAENTLKFTQFSVDRAIDSIYWMDAGGRIAYVNDSACRSTGYSRDELLSMTIHDLDPNYPAEIWPRIWEDIVRLGSEQFESMHRRKDGSLFPVELNVSYLSYDQFEYVCVFARDITERKRAGEALRESEDRWQFALEGSGDGLWDWNVPGNRVYFSRQWKEMIGYAEDEISDSLDEWDSRVHPDDKADVYAKLNDHLEGRSPVYISQHRLLSKDGSYKWVLDRGKVLNRTGDGKPLRIIGTHTDITERKHLESQLLQSQKMEAVGTLAGGVAHDFNNLLSAIMGYASLMQMKMEKHDPLYSYASHILTSSEKAANLTQSLLAFSRKQVIDLKPVALNDTVEKLHRLLERLIPEDVEFRVNKCDERLIVMADVGQLDQVIMNLVTNARDAMPRGGKLTIRIDRAADNSHFMATNKSVDLSEYALIEISDTGAGMDKKTIEKIFEPFFTTKELGRGTGLGLSIVYGIIKQHNGYIDVRSQPGEGSIFSVYLPLVWMEPEDDRDIAQIVGGIETILIAEDNRELCQLSMRVLRDHGYSVLAAMDGLAAVEMFRQHAGEIALVILDVVMPKMNGKEAYEAIRKIEPSAKVIFTSGYTDDIVIERGVENEECDFLGKPLTPATLLKKIREVLDRQ
jgi:two-component system, cell cycle sensor histidine kinase and response regulator CckA